MRRRGWSVLILFGLFVAGCGMTTISQVLTDPAKYKDKTVTVQGTVDQSVSLLGKGAYRIADSGQKLWVVTTIGAPREGARVEVTGRVQDGYDLSMLGKLLRVPEALQTGVVLIESSHKARD